MGLMCCLDRETSNVGGDRPWKTSLGRPRRWKGNINTNLMEIDYEAGADVGCCSLMSFGRLLVLLDLLVCTSVLVS
jgi:hypothetical protein